MTTLDITLIHCVVLRLVAEVCLVLCFIAGDIPLLDQRARVRESYHAVLWLHIASQLV